MSVSNYFFVADLFLWHFYNKTDGKQLDRRHQTLCLSLVKEKVLKSKKESKNSRYVYKFPQQNETFCFFVKKKQRMM